MSGFGHLALVSGALELSVPSYSLRLVRRFGPQRVGWFLVAAFSCLAALHLVTPFWPLSMEPASGFPREVVAGIAASLLLIGLCHLETMLRERQETAGAEQRLRARWETQAQQQTAELVRANQDLLRRIAQLERAEGALRQSEADYCLLFEENPQPMWVFDLRSFRLLAGNKAALRQYGLSAAELKSLTARDLLAPSAASRFLQDSVKPCPGVQSRGLWQHRRKDGTLLDVEVTGLDLRYSGVPARLILASDLGLRRQRERELCEAQRQAVTRRVAGGVAHHFNNILSIIGGYASLLLHQSRDEKSAQPLTHISAAVKRAAGLSRQLLITSGQFAVRQELVDLTGLITNLEPMLRRLVGNEIALRCSGAPGLPRILADVRLLEHIVVNLVLNARNAMPRGGMLTISTDLVARDEHPSAGNERAKPARLVRLGVHDTGRGIAPEVEPHLFEPFFSTHDIGNGTGLGLASVQGAVKQQGGWIEYTTQAGVGTEFRVFFPEGPVVPAPRESDFRAWVRC